MGRAEQRDVAGARPVEVLHLRLLGPFGCRTADGIRVEVTSRKGRALLAMLALASGGERTRGWLQDRLWGSRGRPQAQQSLRNEVAGLRRVLGRAVIDTHADQVRLALAHLVVDVREVLAHGSPADRWRLDGEFLEGLDIPGEEGFEDWLRDTRQALRGRLASVREGVGVDPRTTAPPVGFTQPATASDLASDDRVLLMLQPGTPAPHETDPTLPPLATAFHRDLHDRLARLRWLGVVAQGRTAADAARYRLETEWAGTGDAVTLAPALVDTAGGRTIWSTRLVLENAGDAAGATMLARDLVGAVDAQIEVAEQSRVLDLPIDRLRGNDLAWRARWHWARLTRADARIAGTLIDRLRAERPHAAETLIQAGFHLAWGTWVRRATTEVIDEVRALGVRAAAADRFDARGHLLIGMADTWLRRPDRARRTLEHAIELNPSSAQTHMQLGSALYLAGEPAAALAPMQTALRLNPHDPMIFCVLAELGMAHLMLGRHAEAADFADRSLVRRPGYWFAHLVRVNALRLSGSHAAADAAFAELIASHPGFDSAATNWIPFADTAWNDRLASGLLPGDHG